MIGLVISLMVQVTILAIRAAIILVSLTFALTMMLVRAVARGLED
jgi:hypothetical protein